MPIGLGRGPFTAPGSMQRDCRARRALAVSSRRKALDADSRPFVLRSGLAGREYRSSLLTHFEATASGERTSTTQSHRRSATPISSRHCWAPRMLVSLYQTGGPMATQDIDQSVDELPIHGCPRLGRGAVEGRRGAALARASSLGRLPNLQILWRNPPAMSPGPSIASTPECASPQPPPSASRASSSTSASGSDSVHTARLRTRHSSVTPSSV